jgi:hypothetical protein
MPVSATVKALFSKSRVLNTGFPEVTLNESELFGIFKIICTDLGWEMAIIELNEPQNALPSANYYEVPLAWFESHHDHPGMLHLLIALQCAVDTTEDFGMYFGNVCSLHKRRLKFQKILSYQPKPTMDQVGPRGLLEYGICGNHLLNNWLIWRKWLFDIDNRSGQETGYLFEPVLANSLGGVSMGSSNSPVKRIGEDGQPTSKGRQIDCFIGAENLAYEFKLRVTIAASGQGRFGEELSFPRECQAAKITPILVVLDPTPSNRLSELSAAFIQSGGRVYIGDAAWRHLEEQAGAIMANFIDNYIKPPLAAINEFDTNSLSPIKFTWENERIVIANEESEYIIKRNPNAPEATQMFGEAEVSE